MTDSRPHITIRFLLAWTIWTAIVLALDSRISETSAGPGDGNEAFGFYRQISSAVNAFLLGAGLAGTGTLVAHRRRFGPPLAYAPGHYLLLSHATFVFYLIAYWLIVVIPSSWIPSEFRINSKLYGVVALMQAGWLIGGFVSATEPAWKIVFGGLSATLLLRTVAYIAPAWGGMTSDLVMAAWVMGCMLVGALGTVEAVRRIGRDWLHWLGIVCLVADGVTSVVWSIWIRFFFLR